MLFMNFISSCQYAITFYLITPHYIFSVLKLTLIFFSPAGEETNTSSPHPSNQLKKCIMLVSSSCVLHPFCWGPPVFIWMSIYRIMPQTLSDQSDHLYAYECTAVTEHTHHHVHKKTRYVTGSGWQAVARVIRQSLWQPRHWLVIAVVCQVSGAASKSTAFRTA